MKIKETTKLEKTILITVDEDFISPKTGSRLYKIHKVIIKQVNGIISVAMQGQRYKNDKIRKNATKEWIYDATHYVKHIIKRSL